MNSGLRLPPDIDAAPPRRIGVLLGSFDPPHRAHLWLAHNLLAHFDLVLMLVAARHVHKNPAPPLNASFDQRLAMLHTMASPRLHAGLTETVLFLDLEAELRSRFPRAAIGFAMGDGTFAKLKRSRTYFERSGRRFGAVETSALERLVAATMVFNRSGDAATALPMPSNLRRLSSTAVRAAVARCRAESSPLTVWYRRLLPMLTPPVLEIVRSAELYPELKRRSA